MLTPSFHFTILNTFTDIFINNAEILMKKLESRGDGEPFDIFPHLSACTLDIICGKNENLHVFVYQGDKVYSKTRVIS